MFVNEYNARYIGETVKKTGLDEIIEIYDFVIQLENRNYFSENEAIELIKNITIASYYVPYERFDYFAVTGEAILSLTKFININGTIKFKIVYALYQAAYKQFRKELHVCIELMESLEERFDCLFGRDIELAKPLKDKYFRFAYSF